MEAHPGPVEVYLGAVEPHPRSLDAHPGPVEVILGHGAHPGAVQARPGPFLLNLGLCRLNLDPWGFIFLLAVKAHPGALKTHPGALEAYSGAVKAHPKEFASQVGSYPLSPLFCTG